MDTLRLILYVNNKTNYSKNPAGSFSMLSPRASLICVEKITTAMPLVKPTIRGCGK